MAVVNAIPMLVVNSTLSSYDDQVSPTLVAVFPNMKEVLTTLP